MTRSPQMHSQPKPSLRGLYPHHPCDQLHAAAPEFEHEHRYGRVARYAWGRDYHEVVKPRLVALAAEVETLCSPAVAML
jgi:epoxyqueuosine reductase QueG